MLRHLFFGTVGLLLLTACDGTLDVDDYDVNCETTNDCAAVIVGDICDCSCEYGAINKSSLPAYNGDRAISCDNTCAPCPNAPPLTCEANVCGVSQ